MKNIIPLVTKFRQQSLKQRVGPKTVGYFCLYVPPELIESAGFRPVRLAGLGDGVAENEGEKFLHNEGCSFCKECLGLKSLKRQPYDTVDYLIVPTGCDQMKRQGEMWHCSFGVPTYHLFVPATWEDSSCQEIYWQELKWLAEELNALPKNLSHPKPLETIVARYNEARKRLKRLRGVLSYAEYFHLAHLFFISPVSEFRTYLDEIEKKITGKPEPEKKVRLLLVGSPVGYGDDFLQKALAKHSEVDIVYDATCTGQRAFEIDIPTSGDMAANVAAAYFTRPPCIWQRPNSRFYQYIQGIIKKYRIDGIIYKTLKFCDVWKYEAKRFQDWANCPVVSIENTYSPAQEAQINKRLSVFLDML